MMDSSGVWDNQDPTLSVPSQEDFNQFLDMGMNNLGDPLQFDFPDFNSQQPGQAAHLIHHHDSEAMDHSGLENGRGVVHDTTMQEHMPSMTTAASHPSILGAPMSHNHPSNESLVELDAQIQYLQHQRQQRQQQQAQQQLEEQQRNYYAQNRMIPPTPTSMELHGASSQFYPQSDPQHQAMYERFRMQMKDQEVSHLLFPLKARYPSLHSVTYCTSPLIVIRTYPIISRPNHLIDGLYASGITCGDSARGSFQHPRVYHTWSIFQSHQFSCASCTE
jgi:hypothetical protein